MKKLVILLFLLASIGIMGQKSHSYSHGHKQKPYREKGELPTKIGMMAGGAIMFTAGLLGKKTGTANNWNGPGLKLNPNDLAMIMGGSVFVVGVVIKF